MIPIVPKTIKSLPSPSSSISSFKKRRRLASHETEMLIKVFEKCSRPSIAVKERLSKALGLSSRAIQIWFQNRRAKLKREQEQTLAQNDGNMLLSFTPTISSFDSTTNSENMASSNGFTCNEDDISSCPECQIARQQQPSCSKSKDILLLDLQDDCFPDLSFGLAKQEMINSWLDDLIVQKSDGDGDGGRPLQENNSNDILHHFNTEPSIEELIKMILC